MILLFTFQFLNRIFSNVNGTVKVLEDSLCDWRQFGFQKYEGNIELLGNQDWKTGHAIQLFIRKENFMRHEIQGGRKFYKKYKKQSMHALSFQPPFQRYAELNLKNVAKKVSKVTYTMHTKCQTLKINVESKLILRIFIKTYKSERTKVSQFDAEM